MKTDFVIRKLELTEAAVIKKAISSIIQLSMLIAAAKSREKINSQKKNAKTRTYN